EGGGDAEQRRFSGAVGTEEAEDVAAPGGEGDAGERAPATEMPRDVDQRDLVEIDHHAATEPSAGPGPISSLSSAPYTRSSALTSSSRRAWYFPWPTFPARRSVSSRTRSPNSFSRRAARCLPA